MMKRELVLSPLYALLSGLMLAACGGEPEAGLAPAEESQGTHESAICAGSSVSSLTISGFSSWGGEAAGAGNWAVTYPANGVHLDFYIDGVKRGSAKRQGDASRSGTWNFSYSPVGCGSHTFEVRAYPITYLSNGELDECPTSGTRLAKSTFTQSCPTASLSCNRTSYTSVSCTGSGSGGTGGYTPFWQEAVESGYGGSYTGPWYQGAWTQTYYCPETTVIYPTDRLRVAFKVRDSSGAEAYSLEQQLLCEAGSLM